MYYYAAMYQPNELYHYGVKGMRWGVRRYQNEDGSLTSAGQRHRAEREGGSYSSGSSSRGSSSSSKKAARNKKLKKVGKVLGLTAAAAATAAASYYGGKKLGKYLVNKHYGKNERFTNAARKFSSAVDAVKNNKAGLKNKAKYYTDAARNFANSRGEKIKTASSRIRNQAGMRFQDAKSKYKNSGLGRKVATERFKYQNGLGGIYNTKERAVNAANRAYERGSMYGHKVRTGVSNAANRAYERGSMYGHKVRTGVSNAANRAYERGALYGNKVRKSNVGLRTSIVYNNARRKAYNTYNNALRKKQARKIRYKGF